jgi:hypothetical protein
VRLRGNAAGGIGDAGGQVLQLLRGTCELHCSQHWGAICSRSSWAMPQVCAVHSETRVHTTVSMLRGHTPTPLPHTHPSHTHTPEHAVVSLTRYWGWWARSAELDLATKSRRHSTSTSLGRGRPGQMHQVGARRGWSTHQQVRSEGVRSSGGGGGLQPRTKTQPPAPPLLPSTTTNTCTKRKEKGNRCTHTWSSMQLPQLTNALPICSRHLLCHRLWHATLQ